MSRFFKLLVFICLFTWNAQANYSIPPLQDILEKIESTEFEYVGRGKLFDYISTQSCYYRSPNIVILKHYCYPQQSYPARAFSVTSPEFGTLYFYEEASLDRKQIAVENFSSDVKNYYASDFTNVSLSEFDQSRELIYKQWLPSCWSSHTTEGFFSNCNGLNIQSLGNWSQSTEHVLEDREQWLQLLYKLTQKTSSQN